MVSPAGASHRRDELGTSDGGSLERSPAFDSLQVPWRIRSIFENFQPVSTEGFSTDFILSECAAIAGAEAQAALRQLDGLRNDEERKATSSSSVALANAARLFSTAHRILGRTLRSLDSSSLSASPVAVVSSPHHPPHYFCAPDERIALMSREQSADRLESLAHYSLQIALEGRTRLRNEMNATAHRHTLAELYRITHALAREVALRVQSEDITTSATSAYTNHCLARFTAAMSTQRASVRTMSGYRQAAVAFLEDATKRVEKKLERTVSPLELEQILACNWRPLLSAYARLRAFRLHRPLSTSDVSALGQLACLLSPDATRDEVRNVVRSALTLPIHRECVPSTAPLTGYLVRRFFFYLAHHHRLKTTWRSEQSAWELARAGTPAPKLPSTITSLFLTAPQRHAQEYLDLLARSPSISAVKLSRVRAGLQLLCDGVAAHGIATSSKVKLENPRHRDERAYELKAHWRRFGSSDPSHLASRGYAFDRMCDFVAAHFQIIWEEDSERAAFHALKRGEVPASTTVLAHLFHDADKWVPLYLAEIERTLCHPKQERYFLHQLFAWARSCSPPLSTYKPTERRGGGRSLAALSHVAQEVARLGQRGFTEVPRTSEVSLSQLEKKIRRSVNQLEKHREKPPIENVDRPSLRSLFVAIVAVRDDMSSSMLASARGTLSEWIDIIRTKDIENIPFEYALQIQTIGRALLSFERRVLWENSPPKR